MAYPIDYKEKGIRLRKQGYSIREIAQKLHISISTSSVWVGKVKLNEKALTRLKDRKILGQYKAGLTVRKKREFLKKILEEKAKITVSNINFSNNLDKLLCALLFVTEGGKFSDNHVYFINSDLLLVAVFLKLFRSSFEIKEEKMRALVHIHEYHNEEKIKKYWSKITGIPLTQFTKSYLKPHTGKRYRAGYSGSIKIRYHDFKVALELRAVYNIFARQLVGGVV